MIVDYVKIYQQKENYNFFPKKLIWYDDFDGEDLDKTKWNFDVGKGINGWGTNQKQYYTDRKENIYLSNSKLYIKAIKENYRGSLYTSGRINTKNNFQLKYGIIETKIKFPSVKGVSPGFFLSRFFQNKTSEFNEIDALIGKDGEKKISSGCIWGKNLAYFRETDYDITKFNEYTIIWDKKSITIYADDLEIYKIDIYSENLANLHNPFYLNLNVLVGGNTVNNQIDDSAFPVEMVVDYIKVYQYNNNKKISDEIKIDDNSNINNNFKVIYILILLNILLF